MSVTPCRECHTTDQHSPTCSHARYDHRLTVLPEDAVAADHSPAQPYCPGPDVACHYFGGKIWRTAVLSVDGRPACWQTHGSCYYHPEDTPL